MSHLIHNQAKIMFQVSMMLGITLETYCETRFNTGCEYLENKYPDNPARALDFQTNALFWAWWNNMWAGREREWIDEYEKTVKIFADSETLIPVMISEPLEEDELREKWEEIHDLDTLVYVVSTPETLLKV